MCSEVWSVADYMGCGTNPFIPTLHKVIKSDHGLPMVALKAFVVPWERGVGGWELRMHISTKRISGC